jgi:sarcosine oxidase subunit beta
MNRNAEVVIIGGGVHGCSIAYHLAKKGWKDIVLLEKGYLSSGGTGRSAAGIRHQFGTEINVRLASACVKRMEGLKEELQYNEDIELMQKGYLMLAYSDSQLDLFKENAALQKKFDPENTTVMLSTKEIKDFLPLLNVDGVVGASFNPRDGHANPFHVTQAFANSAKRMGVEIQTNTEVIDILTTNGKIKGVVTNKGDHIYAPIVVNAAGAHGKILAQMVGLDIPVYPERHQILVTEPLEMFLWSMVISFQHGTYFKQTPHGSILMGVGDPEHELKDFNIRSSWQFLIDVAEKISYHMPALKNVNIVRQWAGLYDITPDQQGIVGTTDIEGFYLDLGWSGHGFQLAPAVGQIMAELISKEKPFIDVSCLSLDRFEKGQLIPEPACV